MLAQAMIGLGCLFVDNIKPCADSNAIFAPDVSRAQSGTASQFGTVAISSV